MTTINNPRPDQLQAGDLVYLSHPKLKGEVGVRFDGTNLDFPNEKGTPDEAIKVGFRLLRAERADRTKVTLTGKIESGHLKVWVTRPSGDERVLYDGLTSVNGTLSAEVTLEDFAN